MQMCDNVVVRNLHGNVEDVSDLTKQLLQLIITQILSAPRKPLMLSLMARTFRWRKTLLIRDPTYVLGWTDKHVMWHRGIHLVDLFKSSINKKSAAYFIVCY